MDCVCYECKRSFEVESPKEEEVVLVCPHCGSKDCAPINYDTL